MSRRIRLYAREREALYQDECLAALRDGRGEFPICNICGEAVLPGQMWDASHPKHMPNWLRQAKPDKVAHSRCNRRHGNTHDTPLYAKNERIRRKHLDLKRSDSPLPGGVDDRLKKKLNGRVVERFSR